MKCFITSGPGQEARYSNPTGTDLYPCARQSDKYYLFLKLYLIITIFVLFSKQTTVFVLISTQCA